MDVSTWLGPVARAAALFAVTAIAEILGCYLVALRIQQGRSAWLYVPAAISLALFAWLLTLHSGPAGRTYAAYGAIYVATALVWLAVIEGRRPSAWDVAGGALAVAGMVVIAIGGRTESAP